MCPQRPSIDNETDRQTSNRGRRRFLLGIGAGMTMLAGCLGDDEQNNDNGVSSGNDDRTNDEQQSDQDDTEADDGDTADNDEDEDDTADRMADKPAYSEWLPTEDDWLYVAFVNFDVPGADSEGANLEPGEEFDDPLLTFPLDVGGTTIGLFSLGLAATNLLPVLEPGDAMDSEASSLLVVNGTTVIEGSFDTDELHERLIDGEEEPFAVTYEQAGDLQGYDRYDPAEVPDGVDDPPVVAVEDNAVLVGVDTTRLEQVAETGAGDRPRATQEDDTVAWLVEQAGEGDVVFGHVGPVPEADFDLAESVGEEPPFQPADGEDVMATATFETDELEARFALTAEEITADTRETVETEFGEMGSDISIDVDDDRITASGTYETADFEGEDGGEGERDDLSEEEARALVPADALQFRYEPPLEQSLGDFWVEVVEETDAAAVRVEADSGGHNEVGPQEGTVSAGTGIPVQVDADGDTVTVFAVDEANDIGKLTSKQVPTDELSSEAAEQAVPEDSLSYAYESPESGEFGNLHIEVEADTEAEVLVAQPREAPGGFSDAAGSLGDDESVTAGTRLRVPVDPDEDEVVVFATVEEATGEVDRWEGP